jgi:hypothetical protein
MDSTRSYILNIFIGVICIFALIIFIDVSNINLNLNPDKSTKKLVQVVNIEALKNKNKNSTEEDEEDIPLPAPEPNKSDISINMSPVDDFCKSNSASLKESCGKLTKKNCNATSCCVMLNGKKCVAGNQDGPTFQSESGQDIPIDYYYYQNKCYGNDCPTK